MSTITTQQLRTILANPSGDGFKGRYLPLGKRDGKIFLMQECTFHRLRPTTKAFQIIEKGYSHRQKITYANDITRCDYDFGRMTNNNSGSLSNRSNKNLKNGDIDEFGRTVVKNETEQTKLKRELDKQAQTEKKKLEIEKKRQEMKDKKMKFLKKKLAKLDSWEDLL